jgi:Protein of unknown function (DUF1592)/Protein of unknown function (DUF1588)/Protein of unknown function (DUF1595)/Protein of unknown function (DUF1585)
MIHRSPRIGAPRIGALLVSFALGLGCTGNITNGRPRGAVANNPGAGNQGTAGAGVVQMQAADPGLPAAGHLRRLSAVQFNRSLKDLLGPTGTLPAIEESPASANLKAIGASVTAVSAQGVEEFETATNAAVDALFTDPARRAAFVGCAPATWDEACARAFLTAFGLRAWRRPLTADETTRYLTLGQQEAQDAGNFAEGAHAIASALLQSPNFLYRVELGATPAAGQRFGQYTPFETATRLSYLLWSTTPDQQLLTAAANGGLATPDGIRAEEQRLIASPRLVDGLDDMVDDLLALDNVALMAKDPKLYPQLTPTLRVAMRGEVLKMFEDTALTRDADLMELFDTNRTFVNAELGKLYGITVTGTDLVAAQHPAGTPRAGLLTTAAVLTVQDKQYQTSPTRRGAFFRRTFVCEQIPDPPPNVNVNIQPPPAGVVLSRRELLSGHAKDASCAGCHSKMDSIGLAFENFDAMAIYRTKDENGATVDPSGSYDGTPFAGPRELGALLRASDKARDCMARRIYRFAMGREETAYDEVQIKQLGAAFAAGGQRFRPYLASLIGSDGFMNVSPAQKQ